MPLVFDLETNGLLPDVNTIHCLCIHDLTSGAYTRYDKTDVPKGLMRLSLADEIIGHNIISYDIPVIKHLYPEWHCPEQVRDTLVLSRVCMPDIKEIDFGLIKAGKLPAKMLGRYSLEAWGYRLGVYKGTYGKQENAWDHWSPEMSEYCEQDVRVTVKLLKFLEDRLQPEHVLDLEHRVAWIISRQERRGVTFNVGKAERIYTALRKKKLKLLDKLRGIFPPFWAPVSKMGVYVSRPQLSNFDIKLSEPLAFIPKADNKRMGYRVGAPCTKVELKEFDPASNHHIIWMLKKKYNWEPTEWTEKSGEPKIDDAILEKLPYPEAKPISKLLTINKRLAQLLDGNEGWLKKVQADGKIHGAVATAGAVTRRMTHFAPNMAQVPAGYSPYGAACRSLFGPSPGYKQVGCDAAGLEARCLAHYLYRYDQGAYAKALLEGKKEDKTDVHSLNAAALGVSRDDAKTFLYAWMYGAGDAKIAKILKCTVTDAKKKKQQFLDKMKAFKGLTTDLAKVVRERGYLIAIDGGRLKIRSPHSALNTLLQSAGAIVMKKALVILDDDLRGSGLREGIDYEFILNVHDEWQIECLPGVTELVGKTAVWAIEEAGRQLKFLCPLTGEYSVGKNWKETH